MPVVLSKSIVLTLAEAGLPLDHPRACIENLLQPGSVSASSYVSDEFHPENVIDGNTFDWWRPTAMPAWVGGLTAAAEDVDFVGIAAHTLGSDGCTAVLQYNNGSGWIDCHDPVTPIDDDVLMVFFDTVFSSLFRLYVSGGSAPSIGVLYVGRAFVFPQKFYVGYTPITFDTRTEFKRNVSDGGYDLGRTIMRDGVANSFTVSHLPAQWVRSQLVPALDIMDTQPFFFAWRPGTYPTEVAYVWTQGSRPSPINSGPGSLMSVSFDVRGMVL
jgi:hypothetical protein